jgi:pimeloyl-ACP methyl ester carboxylesterase
MFASIVKKQYACLLTLAIVFSTSATPNAAQAIMPYQGDSTDSFTIRVTIDQVDATNRFDGPCNFIWCDNADFFAVATIDGQQFATDAISNNDHIRPNWQFRKDIGPQGTDDWVSIQIDIRDSDNCGTDPNCGNQADLTPTVSRAMLLRVSVQACARRVPGAIAGDGISGQCGVVLVSRGTAGDNTAEIRFHIEANTALGGIALTGMERPAPYLPPMEPAQPGVQPPEFVPPTGFVDYWDWSRIQDEKGGVRTGRLAPWLRDAARTRSPIAILQRAVIAAFRPKTNNATAESRALADLAVSGRTAFAAFILSRPQDEALFTFVKADLAGIAPDQIRAAVRRVLDRAYTVAWALRGTPSQRRVLRPQLGWIAVSSEDDPPHAPTNVSSTEHHMGELSLSIGRSERKLILRGTLMLPLLPGNDPLPNISDRPIPNTTTFTDALQDRKQAGYDELFLFVHGLGSRAEESEGFKQKLIELGAARGRRYAVLSVDMPGMGYSSQLDLDELIAQRAKGHHGFALPNGRGSNFPLLGLYRDTLVEICNSISGGVQYVMGGSLGGNMTLWLAAEPMFSDLDPTRNTPSSVVRFLSWSPASIWESYERSRDIPEGNGTHVDIGKNGAKKRSKERMQERENDVRRWGFFETMQRGEELFPGFRVGAWSYPPTKGQLLLQSELYSEQYRRILWAASYEQVVFSHQEPLTPSGRWPYETIAKPLFLASGAKDVGSQNVMDIFHPLVAVSDRFPKMIGRRLLMLETGHSISDERPQHLASQIIDFLFAPSEDNSLFQLQRNGRIWRHTGTPCSGESCPGWQMFDNNSATVAIVAGGSNLYQLHRNGRIWRHTGTPCSGESCPGWQMLDNNPATVAIVAGGNSLYQLHRNGRIWRHTGTPCAGESCSGWQMLDNNPATVMLASDLAGR